MSPTPLEHTPIDPVSHPLNPLPAPGPAPAQNSVSGQIVLENGLPAANITVRAYSRAFGGADVKLDEAKTDAAGNYTLSYPRSTAVAAFDVRAVDATGKEITLCDTIYDPAPEQALNLVAPASLAPLAPEYQRLTGDLVKHVGTLDKLATAREDADQQDLTMLYTATGWDARLSAMAATAMSLSKTTGIAPDALYGLHRAGLPSDPIALAQVSADAIGLALNAANANNIVKLDDAHVTAAKTAFQAFALNTLKTVKTPDSVSAPGEFVGAQGVALGANPDPFLQVFFNTSDPAMLWQQAQAKGVSATDIAALQLQGKLAHLTTNNAALTKVLHTEIGNVTNLAQLVDKDLHQPDGWKTRLNTLANNNEQALAALIPPGFGGDTTAARADAYAADLARRVRVAFPTQVAARMLEKGDLQLAAQPQGTAANVAKFLRNAAPLGFKFGSTPVDAFIAKNGAAAFAGINDQAGTKAGLKLVYRLHQITPSDESLQAMLAAGFTSAHDIIAIPYDKLISRYAHQFPSLDELILIYRRAQQVTTTVITFFSAAKKIDSSPLMFGTSPSADVRQAAKQNLIQQCPTLQNLFGSLDFCDCEECGSVLSPAAYLVDLLQFLDPKPIDWQSFLADWQSRHQVAYPFKTQADQTAFTAQWNAAHPGQPAPNASKTPYEVLTERRPDLPNLPLTCENTNTELPYIDLANEILEYFVVNGKLAADSGHDTGEAQSAELIAEPQNILPAAYDKLKAQPYPLTLPLDLWLETVRHFLGHFGANLSDILELFRPADDLFPPPVAAKAYYRNDIFMESLGLAPCEYALFTDPATLASWFKLYGYQSEPAALSALASAKTLSGALGVTYRELADLVTTGFINPGLNGLIILKKLGVSVEDALRYEKSANYPAFTADEQAAFDQKLIALGGAAGAGVPALKATFDQISQGGSFNKVLLLYDTDPTGCNFDKTILRYADGTAADPIAYLRLNLFVRLWRKLGWTMEETDRALQVAIPKNSQPLTMTNVGSAFQSALIYLSHLKSLDERLAIGANSRIKLLTLWSRLPTTGRNPLYAQLFLTPSILKNDAVFDDPLGNYLSAAGLLLGDHLPAVQAALNLPAEDIGRILADAGQDVTTAALSLDTVSLLYRYGLLAKALQLSVRDLISLKALSGLDPFAGLKHDPITTLEADVPFSQTMRFVEVAGKVQASGFKIDDLDYLLRHQINDPVGKYRDDPGALLVLVKALAGVLRPMQAGQALPADLTKYTDDMLQQELALVLPTDAVTTFMGMWSGKVQYQAQQANVTSANKLDPTSFSSAPAVTVTYDAAAQTQSLTVQGVVLDVQRTALQAANASPLLAALLADVVAQQKTFYDTYLAPFLSPSDYQIVFAPQPTPPNSATAAARLKTLLAGLAPYARRQLTVQLTVQTLAAALGTDPSLIQTLITDPTLLADPSAANGTLLGAFASAADSGVNALFYGSPDQSGQPLAAQVQISNGIDTAAKPAGTNSAHFEGYFEVPSPGPYTFYVELGKQGARVQLKLPDLSPNPIVPGTSGGDTAASDNTELVTVALVLKAGVPYHFTADFYNLSGGNARILVQGEGLPKDTIAQLTLYSNSSVQRVGRARVLLAKTLLFTQMLPLDELELKYLLTHAADFGGLSFSMLPTRAQDSSAANALQLFAQFLQLADYTQLKNEVAGGGDDLIGVFEATRLTYPASADAGQAQAQTLQGVCQAIAVLTRRELPTVQAAAAQLSVTAQSSTAGSVLNVEVADFTRVRGIARLWQVLQLTQKLGVPVTALAAWATPRPDYGSAQSLRNTVKAQYAPETWLAVAPSIFDKLRQLQRDALVAYIIQQNGFEDENALFEYFLIDPGMEPVVLTSRLRLALSSLQTFVQRCLLNLEPEVDPSALNADLWQWMKQYRVWQANREIFLFPENWLQPEFRDDKTELYQQLESTLLQGDITNDRAEDAFFAYLKGLESIARLEIVTIYCAQDPHDISANTLHVIGRTHDLPHKYYYRRYAFGVWTPWQTVDCQIDGDQVVALMWRGRLNLFWVTFLEKHQENSSEPITIDFKNPVKIDSAPAYKTVQAQLNWSEYFQGAWTTRGSSGFGNPMSVEVPFTFDTSTVFIHGSVAMENEVEVAKIHLHFDQALLTERVYWRSLDRVAPADFAFKVVSKNSPPEIVGGDAPVDPPYTFSGSATTHYTGQDPLQVTYVDEIVMGGFRSRASQTTQAILSLPGQGAGNSFSLTVCGTPVTIGSGSGIGSLVSPFFFQDNQNAFFVQPWLTETTVTEWGGWVIPSPPAPPWVADPDWWKNLPLESAVPAIQGPTPSAGTALAPGSRFNIKVPVDWATHPATVVQYGSRFIGQTGSLGITLAVAQGTATSKERVSVQAGSAKNLTVATTGIGGIGVRKFAVVGSGGLDPRFARTMTLAR